MIVYEFVSDAAVIESADVRDVNGLLSQLSAHPCRVDAAEFRKIASCTRFMVVREGRVPGLGRIIGMGLLIPVWKPTGPEGDIDDIVVSQRYRGKQTGGEPSIGEQIMRRLEVEARRLGLQRLRLTCRPHREAAAMLYLKLGYERKDTRVYVRSLV